MSVCDKLLSFSTPLVCLLSTTLQLPFSDTISPSTKRCFEVEDWALLLYFLVRGNMILWALRIDLVHNIDIL